MVAYWVEDDLHYLATTITRANNVGDSNLISKVIYSMNMARFDSPLMDSEPLREEKNYVKTVNPDHTLPPFESRSPHSAFVPEV